MIVKAIAGFPGYYATDDGQILSAMRGSVRAAYRTVTLVGPDGVNASASVHRIICAAFHGECPDGMEVRHLDGDPLNNRPDNLAWGTRTENAADRVRHGTALRGESLGTAKLSTENVVDIKAALAAGETQHSIAARFGVRQTNIANIATGRAWSHVPNPPGFERRRVVRSHKGEQASTIEVQS